MPPDKDDTPEAKAEKDALEMRGRNAGIEVDKRHSLVDIRKEVHAAEQKVRDDKKKPKVKEEITTPYIIKPGLSISTKRGNLHGPAAIEAKDLEQGKKHLIVLLKKDTS